MRSRIVELKGRNRRSEKGIGKMQGKEGGAKGKREKGMYVQGR